MTTRPRTDGPGVIHSTVPARIERLPWSRFHRRLVVALGVCWILDGFEITMAANLGEQLSRAGGLDLSPVVIGAIASVYLLGEVVGALVFGHLSDRLGRRRLFFATLALYMVGSAATAFVPVHGVAALVMLYTSRFVAGAGIGGEYAAINSMVDEFVPASSRGRVDIAVNGTYWAGAALAGAVQIPLLSGVLDPDVDWRLGLLLGPVAAVFVWFLRRDVPESPRWLIAHGRVDEAEEATRRIENAVDPGGAGLRGVDGPAVAIAPREGGFGYLLLLQLLFRAWPGRATLAATVMVAQSFFYNAVFFMYPSILVRFFDVESTLTGEFVVPFAVGNLLGPLVLGPLFDRVGRRRMIYRTYVMSGLLLVVATVAFQLGLLTATTQTLVWCVVFFFASAGASAAYLTVSEIFPVEVRAKSVALFVAIAQTVGATAPPLLGLLIDGDHPRPSSLMVGLVLAAAVMVGAGAVARRLAVDAENRSLEDVAPPLSFVRSPGA